MNRYLFPFLIIIILTCLSACTSIKSAEERLVIKHKNTKHWYHTFENTELNNLQDELYAKNLDIKEALARFLAARSAQYSEISSLFPKIEAQGTTFHGNNINNSSFSDVRTIEQGGFNASWELDLFGSTRAKVKNARAFEDFQKANLENIMLITSSDLTNAYLSWSTGTYNLYIQQDIVKTVTDQVSLTETKYKAGFLDSRILELIKTEQAKESIALNNINANVNEQLYKLHRLISNEKLIFKASDITIIPAVPDIAKIEIGVVQNRPDIKAAEANIISAQSNLDAAISDIFPKITLGAFFGVQDARIIGSPNPIWNMVSAVSMNLFSFGKLAARIDSSNLQLKAEEIAYKNTVLKAIEEVKIALSDYIRSYNNYIEQQNIMNLLKLENKLAKDRNNSGLEDDVTTNTSLIRYFQSEIAYNDAKLQALIAYIRLNKALAKD